MNRREFLSLAAAASAAAGCTTSTARRTTAVAKAPGGGDPRMRGPFPIMTTPFNADGSVDYESLVREALFVQKSGCPGVIWCQSNLDVDLLTFEEKKRGYETLARALEGGGIMLTFGCNGRDAGQMLREARAVEEVAAKFPRTNIAIISRPPDSGKTQDDIREYYEKLAEVARRPVIIQTYVNKTCPSPEVKLIVDLARRHPDKFGYVKEESEGDKANDRMVEEVAAHDIQCVGWLAMALPKSSLWVGRAHNGALCVRAFANLYMEAYGERRRGWHSHAGVRPIQASHRPARIPAR